MEVSSGQAAQAAQAAIFFSIWQAELNLKSLKMLHPLTGHRFLPHVVVVVAAVVPDATMGGRHPACHDACSSMFDSTKILNNS